MRKIRIFGHALVAINLLTLAAAAYFWISATDLEVENNNLLAHTTKLKLRVSLLKETSKNHPDLKQLVKLRDDIGRINSILIKHEFDANSALEAIEKNTPTQVYFQQFKHDSETGKITFKAVSDKNNKLTQFLKNLEQESLFKQVSLVRKDSVKESGKLHHRIEIELDQVSNASGEI